MNGLRSLDLKSGGLGEGAGQQLGGVREGREREEWHGHGPAQLRGGSGRGSLHVSSPELAQVESCARPPAAIASNIYTHKWKCTYTARQVSFCNCNMFDAPICHSVSPSL